MELDALGHAASHAVDGLVRQIVRSGAAPPFEEADQLAADGFIALACALTVRVELREEDFEALSGETRSLPWRFGVVVAARHLHSPCREKPAQ